MNDGRAERTWRPPLSVARRPCSRAGCRSIAIAVLSVDERERSPSSLPTAIPSDQIRERPEHRAVLRGLDPQRRRHASIMVFGYFNRNWEEQLAIPAGPDNIVEPGGPDRGQPTFFLPRRQGWVYRVRVPS